jgi:hypothetical protein
MGSQRHAALRRRGRFALPRLAPAALVALALLASVVAGGRFGAAPVAAADCQTSFLVFSDPNNVGQVTTRGDILTARNSGILGTYSGGRFDGFTISGLQTIRLNQATGKATINGSFVATSPDGQSSFTFRYQGKADLVAAKATGSFAVVHGTGSLARFRASGTIAANYMGNFTFSGIDIGLC